MMLGLGPVVLLVVVGASIWMVTAIRRRHQGATGASASHVSTSEGPSAESLAAESLAAESLAAAASDGPATHATHGATLEMAASLARWQAAGLISADQVIGIEAFEHGATTRPAPASIVHVDTPVRRVPVVAEALGYLGGILGVVGLLLLVTKYWPDMGTPAHLALALGAAIALTVAGVLVPHQGDAALERLRWFVWLGATAAGALAAGVVAVDVFDAEYGPTVALACAAAVMVHSALLWKGAERPVQQLTCLVGFVVTTGTAVAQFADGGPVGVAIWCAGAVLLLTGIRELTTFAPITLAIGGAATLVGAGVTTSEWRSVGVLLLMCSAAALLGLAAATRPLRTTAERAALTVIGVMGMTQAVPLTIQQWGEQFGIVTGAAYWCAGAGLLLVAGNRAVRTPTLVRLAGGAALVGGAAVMGMQSQAVATIVGIATAIGLLVLGTYPEHVLLSIFGCVGLLVNVPWAIRYFFPGEGRVPLLILVSGVLIVAVAVWLSRIGGEIRHQFHFHHH